MSSQVDSEVHLLHAKVDNARVIVGILKVVNFKETADVYVTSLGLKVVVESHQSFQANAFLQASLFHQFDLNEEQVSFKVNFSILLECLSIFGTSLSAGSLPTLTLKYDGYGEPLILILEEGGVVTHCSIKTMDCDMPMDFDFSAANLHTKIIMKAETLREMFLDIYHKSEVVEVSTSPDSFRMTTWSDCGDNSTEIVSTSQDIEKFDCKSTQSFRYKTSLLKLCNKALFTAQKASLRIDNRGFISLQLMIFADESQPSFIDFLCVPDEEYD